MSLIQLECRNREITRICHFTQSRNLAHIFDDPPGLYSKKTLQQFAMPHNPSDPDRYDGRDDLICCSIEYPNTYYFSKVRDQDHLFKDWVVLFIESKYIWHPDTWFCPCNAARSRGAHIQNGINGFRSLYGDSSPGISFRRPQTHLPAAPTDIQAEVLLKDPISVDSIVGMAVLDERQAQREIFRLELQGITLPMPIYIAPVFFDRQSLSRLIQSGHRPTESLYT